MLHADGDISMEGLWTSAGASFHRVCMGYNGHGDMDIWFDGVKPGGGATTRLEMTWTELVEAGISENVPEEIALSMYPNPFNSALEISLPADYEVSIYDCSGKRLAQNKGSFVWRPQNLPSGIYIIRAANDHSVLTERVVYLK